MRFRIITLGCKVNQYDSAALAQALTRADLTGAEPRSRGPADLVIVNTCCVTATAMAKSRQAIARAVRASPGAPVWVTGCYGAHDAPRLSDCLVRLGVPREKALVTGPHDDISSRIARVGAMLGVGVRPSGRPYGRSRTTGGPMPWPVPLTGASVDSHRQEQPIFLGECGAGKTPPDASVGPASVQTSSEAFGRPGVKRKLTVSEELPPLVRFPGRHRAIVKVQDGCDAFCTYCIVPYVRPRMQFRPLEAVEQECRTLVSAGHREIVLCGVFLGAYGMDTTVRRCWGDRRSGLAELIRRIAAIDGLWRLRLSSLDCGDVTEELLSACRETPKLAPHFHLPLQSGADRILRRMNRRYTPRQFLRAVARLRMACDRPAITTDILVGFPGEDDGDFADTLAVAREAGFAKIHAFPFSAIEGTAAYAWRNEVPPRAVVKARMVELAALEARLASDYRRQFAGQTLEAIVEGRGPPSPVYRAWGPRRAPSRPDCWGPRRSVALQGPRWIARTDRYFTVTLSDKDVRPGQIIPVTIPSATEGCYPSGKPPPQGGG